MLLLYYFKYMFLFVVYHFGKIVINHLLFYVYVFKSQIDEDECNGEGSEHNCSPNAVCTNTEGRFMCECKDGWSGDGVSCTGTFCLDCFIY